MNDTAPSQRQMTGNRFLDSLPAASAERLLPQLIHTAMPYKMLIARADEPVQRVSFPNSGVISAVTQMRDGTEVEVTLVGREGFYGLPCVLGDGTSTSPAMVQLPGEGYTIPSHRFVEALRTDPELSLRTLRYAETMIETVGQFSGCNRLHELEKRCARWLLMVRDRVASDDMPLTHEYLATMLGVNRPSVSLVTADFGRAGYTKTQRGSIVILGRAGLEAIACECYDHANVVLERLMGYRIRP